MGKKSLGKLAITSALGIVLSYSFVFLAALPIRYMRIGFGRWPFLLVSAIATSALFALQQWQWGLVYFSLSFLVGLYSELESHRLSMFVSAAVSVFLTAVVSTFSFGLVARSQGATLFTFLEMQLKPLKDQLAQMPQLQGMDEMSSILLYLPSGLIICLMIILFVALSVFSNTDGQRNSKILTSFRLPDALIWIFIAALAGAFLLEKGSLQSIVAINVLSVTLAGYFFQGLAVTTQYLDYFRIFGFWRMLFYFLIFFQMFIVVSGVGVLDYWLDFRSRLNEKKKLSSRGEERS